MKKLAELILEMKWKELDDLAVFILEVAKDVNDPRIVADDLCHWANAITEQQSN